LGFLISGLTKVRTVANDLPLATLLSQVLVAFTIEFDNEFEHQMPHRTTKHGSTSGARQGPWLVSLVMWSNCMRFVSEGGVKAGELERLARTSTNLNGMERWGYIVIGPDSADRRPDPPRRDWVIRASPLGCKAREVWEPLFPAIEKRWQARFGAVEIGHLRDSLLAVIGQFDVDLPDCLPILGYGLLSGAPQRDREASAGRENRHDSTLSLPTLLSRVLLAFALEFERDSELSIAICANVMRLMDERGMRVRDLPCLSGVSREAINVALGFLQRKSLATIAPDQAGGRAKIACLTPQGRKVRDAYRQLLGAIEERWRTRYGKDAIRKLREPLERLVSDGTEEGSPLFRGLEPYPDGWRASVSKPHTLPHYPMVLHRGGFPDGS
jgi:DNA-binding MarR family transcriptional regulator